MLIAALRDHRAISPELKFVFNAAGCVVHDFQQLDHALSSAKNYHYTGFVIQPNHRGEIDREPVSHHLYWLNRLHPRKAVIAVINTANPLFDRNNIHRDVVRYLDAGADDVIAMPAQAPEAAARLMAVMRRKRGMTTSLIDLADMTIALNEKMVSVLDNPLPVTNSEYKLLRILGMNKGVSMNINDVIDMIQDSQDIDPKIVTVHVCKLRKKIREMAGGVHNIVNLHHGEYALTNLVAQNRALVPA